MDALEGNFFKCLSILYSVYSSISSKSTMKENGQDSAIRGLDQAFKDSKDWNLNIDTSFSSGESPEIIQYPTVLSMGKCPHHCMEELACTVLPITQYVSYSKRLPTPSYNA